MPTASTSPLQGRRHRRRTAMTAGRRGVGLTPMETRRDVMVRTARLADELGYEVFALPEGWGLDSTAVLAEIALSTERIRLASGVLSVWGRTPGTLAMTAATLDQISGGRYVLGLGASTPGARRGLPRRAVRPPRGSAGGHGERRPQAARRRAGPAAQRHRGAAPAPGPGPRSPIVPIWVAALGPRTMQVGADLADGWFPALVALDRLTLLVDRLERPPARPFTVTAGPLAVVDDDARRRHATSPPPASPGT